jgi:hypothetical protein
MPRIVVTDPKASGVAAFVAARKAAIQTWLTTNADAEGMVDFEAVRAAFPAYAAQLTDGMIEEIAKSLGLKVLP